MPTVEMNIISYIVLFSGKNIGNINIIINLKNIIALNISSSIFVWNCMNKNLPIASKIIKDAYILEYEYSYWVKIIIKG